MSLDIYTKIWTKILGKTLCFCSVCSWWGDSTANLKFKTRNCSWFSTWETNVRWSFASFWIFFLWIPISRWKVGTFSSWVKTLLCTEWCRWTNSVRFWWNYRTWNCLEQMETSPNSEVKLKHVVLLRALEKVKRSPKLQFYSQTSIYLNLERFQLQPAGGHGRPRSIKVKLCLKIRKEIAVSIFRATRCQTLEME